MHCKISSVTLGGFTSAIGKGSQGCFITLESAWRIIFLTVCGATCKIITRDLLFGKSTVEHVKKIISELVRERFSRLINSAVLVLCGDFVYSL